MLYQGQIKRTKKGHIFLDGFPSQFMQAEAIRMTVVRITSLIRTTVVPISGVIGPTVVRIANATGIGYRHDGRIRFSNKLTYALNCKLIHSRFLAAEKNITIVNAF